MILGVKKGNFIIYVTCFVVGVCFIVFSFICNKICDLKDIFIGIGCSFIPSSLTAFFLDRINIKADNDKRKQLRNTFSYKLTLGVCYIAKIIIEEFYGADGEDISFLGSFNKAVENAEEIKEEIKDAEITHKRRDAIKNRLSYGLFLCEADANFILQNEFGLIESNVFAKDEIASIKNILLICKEITDISYIAEMVEEIQILINSACDIPKIKEIFQKQILIKKAKIRNWTEIIR